MVTASGFYPRNILLIFAALFIGGSFASTEDAAVAFLQNLELQYSTECNKEMVARWNYIVNATSVNEEISLNATNKFQEFQSSVQAQILRNFSNWETYSDALKREFQYLAIRGPATMPTANVAEMNQIRSKMEAAYAVATVCEYNNPEKCDVRLEPDIEEKLTKVSDYDELEHYWTAWHDTMSKAVKPSDFTRFIQLQNEMAQANGFNDMSEMWLEPYNDGTPGWTAANFKRQMVDTWEALKPFYRKLHAYVRMKLRNDTQYDGKIKKYGYLPANLMGNVWAQDWVALENKTKPYPNVPSLDATEAMKKQNYTTLKMFQEAEKFFQGLGLPPMTQKFWEKSMLERPVDREVVCHASAEDFCLGVNSTDFRIKMCTNVNMEDLVTVHHEMGHIAYFMQYTNQHYVFRDGANPGFHEAIGDALALAVTTPKHLQCVLGLDIGVSCESHAAPRGAVTETDINFLYIMALQKMAFFPFAISMDQWRWEVFEGGLQEEDYNDRWWELRQQNQGVAPPTERHPADFDPAAKYHIVANVPYIRYFVSHILQFQFYEAMCIVAGEYKPNDPNSKPLYQCDFAGNKTAGKLLGDMMELGFTKPWPEALEAITGSRNMSITPLLNYFAPLIQMFNKELEVAGERDCFGRDCQPVAAEYISGYYEKAASEWCNRVGHADWAYNTNLKNAEAEAQSNAANIAYSKFVLQEWTTNISQFDYETFDDSDLTRRQLTFLNAVGISALPDQEIEEYNQVLNSMTKLYGTGKICSYKNQSCNIETEGLNLEPDLENILAHSEDYNELAYVWTGWRNASGKQMRQLYQRYVELSNVAAQLNGYDNMGDFWLLRYESDTFREEVARLWDTVKPLYDELHAYVRYKLSLKYRQISGNDPLPAHVLGNMWAQTWENVYDKVLPYSGFPSFDITDVLKQRFGEGPEGIREMFWAADDFFVATGLANVSVAYNDKAMIIKPANKSVVCHASAWDFCDGSDYRIKMCTKVDMTDFITIHHELGHIQYDIQYKDLPITLREGANPGFHEAIGDVISLSVATPKHMQKIGFLNSTAPSKESTVNYLMKMALDKVAFLPFGYLIDSYRWKIFDGSIGPNNYTYEWLKLRSSLQGIVPPVKRSEGDFDAGAKYHVPGNTPYIRYFVSYILQFQIHKVLCEAAGELANGGLHECDIYEKSAAGSKFKQILQSGASRNWKELLQEITGSPDLDATALLDYFQPLRRFLEAQRRAHGYPLGWNATAFEELYSPN